MGEVCWGVAGLEAVTLGDVMVLALRASVTGSGEVVTTVVTGQVVPERVALMAAPVEQVSPVVSEVRSLLRLQQVSAAEEVMLIMEVVPTESMMTGLATLSRAHPGCRPECCPHQ